MIDEAGRSAPVNAGGKGRGPWSAGRRASTIAAAIVILLAAGAAFWPREPRPEYHGVCVVFDPGGGLLRQSELFEPLAGFLAGVTGHSLELAVVGTVAEFRTLVDEGADFVVCPDGLALHLDRDRYVPLVTGRRTAPRNLRPRCVLLFRQTSGLVGKPWQALPNRTVFGDSLSLGATGILRRQGGTDAMPDCASGPDPYDHSPVLHALRLGCFDYAVVRQWDAERFLTSNLLPPSEWGMKILTGPVPDLVLFASREIPAGKRLDLSGALTGLGRGGDESRPESGRLRHGLAGIHLSGFNLLLEPDLDLVRGSFPGNWPPAAR